MSYTVIKGLQSEIFVPITPPSVWAPVTKPINEWVVAIATAAGVHQKDQERFNLSGDFTWREVRDTTPPDQLMVSHGGYDNSDVNKDINCMYANKQFRLLSAQFKKKSWMTKVVISDTIQLYMDGELNNEVQWSQVDKLVEAKSYFDLEVDGDYLRLDKATFTQGDAESFLTYMKERHPEIPHQEEKPEFNR